MRRPPFARPVITALALCLWLPGGHWAPAAEITDSNLLVEAFGAYQAQDYLLAIDKVRQLTQDFPATPLRDVALLLLARSGLNAGDPALAARSVDRFIAEFPASPLRSGIEEELLTLGARLHRGESLPGNRALQAAAARRRDKQRAAGQALAEKQEQDRRDRLTAERECIAREQAERERRERERSAAEKAAGKVRDTAAALTVERGRQQDGPDGPKRDAPR